MTQFALAPIGFHRAALFPIVHFVEYVGMVDGESQWELFAYGPVVYPSGCYDVTM
jgi:hypothetical protein